MRVRLLGFVTLACGCLVGRYHDLEQQRDVSYVERKGADCPTHTHRRNHAVSLASRRESVSADRPSRVA